MSILYQTDLSLYWNRKQQIVEFFRPDGISLVAKASLPMQLLPKENVRSVVAYCKAEVEPATCFLFLVRDGELHLSKVGNELEELAHQRFYTVRKQQGKSQAKQLRSKGKTSGGGPIRLAQYSLFIREGGALLLDCLKEDNVPIVMGCPPRLMGEIRKAAFSLHPAPDPDVLPKRVRLLSLHYNRPSLAEAKRLLQYLTMSRFSFSLDGSKEAKLLTSLLKEARN